MIVPMPPVTTAATAPKQAAVIPASNSPSWFDVPMNKELTALTRPRISSGVSIWTSECLMTTLITSAAPNAAHGERQQEHRQELGKPDETEIQRTAGERVDLPTHGNGLHLEGDHGRNPGDPKQDKRTVPQDYVRFISI